MLGKTIDHNTLTQFVAAGAVQGAHVVGRSGGWALNVTCGTVERTLTAQRSGQPRVFRRLETLVAYLMDMGIQRFDVDASDHTADGSKIASRPDRSEALRRAHEAAAHDKWFRDQVAQSLAEADDPNTEWVDHDVVKQDIAAQRAELLARINGAKR